MGRGEVALKVRLQTTFNELMQIYASRGAVIEIPASRIDEQEECTSLRENRHICAHPNGGVISLHDVCKAASRQGKGDLSGFGLAEGWGATSWSNPSKVNPRSGLSPLPIALRRFAMVHWAVQMADETPLGPIADGPECLADPRDKAVWGPGNLLLA